MSLGFEKIIRALELANQQQLDPGTLAEVRQYLRELDTNEEVLKSWVRPGTQNPQFKELYIGPHELQLVGASASTDPGVGIPTATAAPLHWTTVTYDDVRFFNLTADDTKITIPTTGIYFVAGTVVWEANNTAGPRATYVERYDRTGAGVLEESLYDIRATSGGGAVATCHFGSEILCDGEDTLIMWVEQYIGSDLSVGHAYLQISRVR